MISAVMLLVAYAVSILLARGRRSGAFPGSFVDIVLIGAGIFHVGPELLRAFVDLSPGPYREGIAESVVVAWSAIVCAGMISFGLGCWTARRTWAPAGLAPSFAMQPETPAERWFFVLVAALAALASAAAVSGLAYGGFDIGNYVIGSASRVVLIPLVVTTAVLSVIRSRHAALVLPLSALALTLYGSRSIVAWGLISGVVLLRMLGCRVSTVKLVGGVAAVGALIVTIAMIRDRVGRWAPDAGLKDRVDAVQETLTSQGQSGDSAQMWENAFAHRIDGNGYGIQVLNAQAEVDPMGLRPILNSLALAVPSFIVPGKTESPVELRNQEYASVLHYNIPDTDYLPTWIGAAVSMFGWLLSIVAAWIFGVSVSLLDLRLPRSLPLWLPVFSSVSIGLLNFDDNIETLILTARSTAIVSLVSVGLWLLSSVAAAWLACPSSSKADVRSGAGS